MATDQHGILTRSQLLHDAYWHRHRLVADRAEDADLVEAGNRVVRVTWDRLTRGAQRDAQRFRTLLDPFPGA